MSFKVDVNAMKAFKELSFENANATLQTKNKTCEVELAGTYNGPLSALKRTNAEKNNNNAVREQLLKSLADTFDLNVAYDKNQKPIFSEDLLHTLESRLGKEVFKRSDFGLKEGRVSSGKPLTARRVAAILDKIEQFSTNLKNLNYPIIAKCEQKCAEMNLSLNANNTSPAFTTAQNCIRLLSKASNGTPAFNFDYLNNQLYTTAFGNDNGDVHSVHTLDTLKECVKHIMGHAINDTAFPITDKDFNVDDEDSPLESFLPQLNTYLERKANDFLEAFYVALNKLEDLTEAERTAALTPPQNANELTLESYTQHLNNIPYKH